MTRQPMTFVGNGPYPRRRGDWADLGRAAAQLLAEREKGYPAMDTAGCWHASAALSHGEADRG
ncbi:MAG: hypothetical protein IIZ30_14880 [Sphingomonas sp.]|uniref:hypothetical protein n=2 Tax=Sphingomonas TaxID=13687 RepID=UPI0013791C76|nr:hypothetical protein [Sphingomonas sp.]MBQ1481306.1 hypothetical protein [Sphingomonas sp.]